MEVARQAFTEADLPAVVRADTPGAIGIARSGGAIPEVRSITAAAEDAAAQMLATATGLYAPGTKPADGWFEMCLALVRATPRIIDVACATRPADLKLVSVPREMVFNLVSPHLRGA